MESNVRRHVADANKELATLGPENVGATVAGKVLLVTMVSINGV